MTRHLSALPDIPERGASRDVAPDLREALAETYSLLVTDDRDRTLATLARRYAKEIEEIVDLMETLNALARISAARGDDEMVQLARRVDALTERVSLLGALIKLGPLLHKALHDLGGAPVARKQAGSTMTASSPLAALRARARGGTA